MIEGTQNGPNNRQTFDRLGVPKMTLESVQSLSVIGSILGGLGHVKMSFVCARGHLGDPK